MSAADSRIRRESRLFALVAVVCTALLAKSSGAQDSATELAKQARNPLTDLVNIPLENDFYFHAGENHSTVYVLNIQPVIPIPLIDDWNLITRTIIPVIRAAPLSAGESAVAGLGDINPTFFVTPKSTEEWIWGAGPSFTFPTATNRQLGSGKWSAGPAFGLVYSGGPWVIGGIVDNELSFAGWGSSRVNQMSLQPAVNYNFTNGWYLTSGPTFTANWEAEGEDRWTVPVGGGFGKAINFGDSSFVLQLQGFYFAEKPQFDPNWQLCFTVQLLFPE